jgi:hypothetical protein
MDEEEVDKIMRARTERESQDNATFEVLKDILFNSKDYWMSYHTLIDNQILRSIGRVAYNRGFTVKTHINCSITQEHITVSKFLAQEVEKMGRAVPPEFTGEEQ